jgi:hypothetical protein
MNVQGAARHLGRALCRAVVGRLGLVLLCSVLAGNFGFAQDSSSIAAPA